MRATLTGMEPAAIDGIIADVKSRYTIGDGTQSDPTIPGPTTLGLRTPAALRAVTRAAEGGWAASADEVAAMSIDEVKAYVAAGGELPDDVEAEARSIPGRDRDF